MKFNKIVFLFLLVPVCVFAQKERGKIIRAPKIFQKKEAEKDVKNEKKVEDLNFNNSFESEADFIFEEEPKLRFSTQFEKKETTIPVSGVSDGKSTFTNSVIQIEPIAEVNRTAQEDTSTIDEGELMIIEIEETGQFLGSDDMVEIASYFSIWDTRSVNPYGLNAKEFNDVVPLKLYDLAQGRYWSTPLEKTPLTSHFGWRWKRWHKGTDIDLETGDPVYAVFDGIVRVAGWQSGWGRTVVVRHYNGLETLYGHLSQINFEENTLVKAGDEIGKGGNTGRSSGSHLHLETRYEGNAFDAENIFTFTREKAEIKSQDFVVSSRLFDYLRGGSSRIPYVEEGEEDSEDGFEEEEAPANVSTIVWYRVRSGDNLTKIARSFNTSVSEICQLNRISAYKKIYAGLKLRVK